MVSVSQPRTFVVLNQCLLNQSLHSTVYAIAFKILLMIRDSFHNCTIHVCVGIEVRILIKHLLVWKLYIFIFIEMKGRGNTKTCFHLHLNIRDGLWSFNSENTCCVNSERSHVHIKKCGLVFTKVEPITIKVGYLCNFNNMFCLSFICHYRGVPYKNKNQKSKQQ